MEQQLEILCRDTSNVTITSTTSHNSIQSFFNKIKELIKTDKHNSDTWEIPIEKISVNDFQGFGSQGDVFFGKINQKAVAIKRVKDRTLTERSYLGNLDHKNLIKFRGVNSKNNYIIMEWCPYGNLQNLIHSGRQIPSDILADFGSQIAHGMNYLHSKNIIHCDLKPSNILLTNNNVLKISDFETHQLAREPCRTDIYGTLPYMAPEMIRGEAYSFPVDVWSYGVVLWEILTGHEPYENSHSSALFWAVGNETHNSKLHIPSSFPSGYRCILEGCWQSLPKSRLTFSQICMNTQSAMQEIFKITKDRWIPLQAQWNKSIREKRNKINPEEVDLIAQKQRRARDEKQMTREFKRNQDIYLKLQETSMLVEREKKELMKGQQKLIKDKQIFEKEKEVFMNEIDMEKQKLDLRRVEIMKRELELALKERIAMGRDDEGSSTNEHSSSMDGSTDQD